MNAHKAIMLVEGNIETADSEEVLEAWQYLVDTGRIFTLPGVFGRTAQSLIDQGRIRGFDWVSYEQRVQALEDEGLTRSDAQGVVLLEQMIPKHMKVVTA
jgi:hypothetical protein